MASSLPPELIERIVENLVNDGRDVAAFARVSTACRAAAIRVDESAARCLRPDARLSVRRHVTTEENARWALDNGCPLAAKTFERAAEEGNLGVMEALREKNCPHDSKACAAAARRGNVEALEWMTERGFGTNFLTCSAAVYSDRAEARRAVRWLSELKKCPCGGTYH